MCITPLHYIKRSGVTLAANCLSVIILSSLNCFNTCQDPAAIFRTRQWTNHQTTTNTDSILYLMNGLVMARMVLINHDGWRIMKDFKFFLSLRITSHAKVLCKCWCISFHFHSAKLQMFLVIQGFSHKTNVVSHSSDTTEQDRPSVNHLIALL